MVRFFRNLLENFREYITLITLLIISLFLISLNNKPGIENFRSYAFGTFAYVTSGIDSFLGLFKPEEEIIQLKKENARLMLELNKLRNHALENSDLRRLLALSDTSDYPLLTASIISKLPSTLDGNYIINRGDSDNVQNGMPVINDKGLIGIIINTAKNFSIVRTLQNAKLNIAVTNQRSGVDGILSWDGQRLVIKHIPTTFDMRLGDRIETSEFSSIFPPSIPVGVIEEKETEVSGLLSNIFVNPYADIPSIQYLFVLQVLESKQVDSLKMSLMQRDK
ncbi:MAG: rod shape-determining protein MreC [Melioribacteraceae bacterium]|nr:rod shape-determining protein MreC [Melioribacteraceae bacterium]